MVTRNNISNSVSKGISKAPRKKKYPKLGANKKMGYPNKIGYHTNHGDKKTK